MASLRKNQKQTVVNRQAIVVVHGQGEQRPMRTLRAFVEALWEKNPELKSQKYPNKNSWVVPDDKDKLFETQRIATSKDNSRKTDFFELYYADLLNDTPLKNLLRWLTRVLWINPETISDGFRGRWVALWVVCLLGVGAFWATVMVLPQLLHIDWVDILSPGKGRAGAVLVVVGMFALVVPQLVGLWRKIKPPTWFPVLIIIAGLIQIGLGYWELFPYLALTLAIYVLLTFMLPYFGDSASYLSAHTETIKSRQAIRKRGLKLLKALHVDPQYDRIIILAHSLGSVVAYDLLHIFWSEVGPVKGNDSFDLSALVKGDETARQLSLDGSEVEAEHYQKVQWEAFCALRAQSEKEKIGWKISDFISMGSPLFAAEFLMADGKQDFARLKDIRSFSTCPPQPYNDELGCIYGMGDEQYAHHGGVFSVVRWSNLYDPIERLFLFGDPITGPIARAKLFGKGIVEKGIKISRNRRFFKRWFTHNLYWINTNIPAKIDEQTQNKADTPWNDAPEHVKFLWKAVGIDRECAATHSEKNPVARTKYTVSHPKKNRSKI